MYKHSKSFDGNDNNPFLAAGVGMSLFVLIAFIAVMFYAFK